MPYSIRLRSMPGRVYYPGHNAGNLHVNIDTTLAVTIAMTTEGAWLDAQPHPENLRSLTFSCMWEHVITMTYECALPASTPMALLVQNERTPTRMVTHWGVIIAAGRQLMPPNNLHMTYYRWDCVANCIQPEFQPAQVVKDKYEPTSVPKMYSVLEADHDGQKVWVKFKAPVLTTIAVLPSKIADQLYDNPGNLSSALQNTSCKQRGVQSLTFDCTVDIAEGTQSLIVVPETRVPDHKKASAELQTLK